jgi:hypothetical protein
MPSRSCAQTFGGIRCCRVHLRAKSGYVCCHLSPFAVHTPYPSEYRLFFATHTRTSCQTKQSSMGQIFGFAPPPPPPPPHTHTHTSPPPPRDYAHALTHKFTYGCAQHVLGLGHSFGCGSALVGSANVDPCAWHALLQESHLHTDRVWQARSVLHRQRRRSFAWRTQARHLVQPSLGHRTSPTPRPRRAAPSHSANPRRALHGYLRRQPACFGWSLGKHSRVASQVRAGSVQCNIARFSDVRFAQFAANCPFGSSVAASGTVRHSLKHWLANKAVTISHAEIR